MRSSIVGHDRKHFPSSRLGGSVTGQDESQHKLDFAASEPPPASAPPPNEGGEEDEEKDNLQVCSEPGARVRLPGN